MSFLKVGFGFYPVGFRVLDGFQIYSRKRPILGKNLKVFRLFKILKNFLELLTIIFLEKWFHSGLKIGSCKNALKFIGYIGLIYQKITNFSSHKNPSGFVGFHSRVRVFSDFSSKVGFGFRSGKNSRGRIFVGFGLDPLHH